jgi:hypothetical protein
VKIIEKPLLEVLSDNNLKQAQSNAVVVQQEEMDWVGFEPTTSAMPTNFYLKGQLWKDKSIYRSKPTRSIFSFLHSPHSLIPSSKNCSQLKSSPWSELEGLDSLTNHNRNFIAIEIITKLKFSVTVALCKIITSQKKS